MISQFLKDDYERKRKDTNSKALNGDLLVNLLF